MVRKKGENDITREQTIEAMRILAESAGIKFTIEEKRPEYNFKQGEEYYFIDSVGDILTNEWNDAVIHINRFRYGNAFKTIADAEKRAKEVRIFCRLKNFADEVNEGWEPDWEDVDENKWFLIFNHSKQVWIANYLTYNEYPNAVYFKARELAERAIKEIMNPFYKEIEAKRND